MEPMFRADLFTKSNVGSEDQRLLLIDELKEVQNKNPNGIGFTNAGCWRENSPCKDIQWLLTELNELIYTAVKFYSANDYFFNSVFDIKKLEIEYWANINLPNSRNSFHTHRNSSFSAVYYIQASNTGCLRFTNPANVMGDCNPSSPMTRDFVINPTDGDLLLWPSWIPHEVETNFSDKERINLAFNIKVKS